MFSFVKFVKIVMVSIEMFYAEELDSKTKFTAQYSVHAAHS